MRICFLPYLTVHFLKISWDYAFSKTISQNAHHLITKTMIYLWFLIWACIHSSFAQQSYDPTPCSSDTDYNGSRYTCNSFQNSCQTFIVYRASQHFQTVFNISDLLGMDPDNILRVNNLNSSSQILKPGREVLVPINCSCSGQFFQANFSYIVPESTTFSEIACGVFEGLLKSQTLTEENPSKENNLKVGTKLHVPLRCACPDNFSISNGVKYLVTYPFIEGDGTFKLAQKFSIPPQNIWAANRLDRKPTVYPNTTVLVPLQVDPVINFNLPDSPPPPGFLPTIPVEKPKKNSNLRTLYIAVSVVGFSLVLIVLLACGFYVKALKKWKHEKFQSFTGRSSPMSSSMARSTPVSGATVRTSSNSCLSPDLLVGIKYSLYNYSIEELRKATRDFSEDTKIDGYVYKGLIDNVDVMIKQIRFAETRQVIDLHSKINHINIVKLHGVCYGETDSSWSYLVFMFPSNGCLRDCLSHSSSPLRWHQRTQIAFDIATGLHYLHYCTFPSYAHMSINSRNIFVTVSWRAKLVTSGTTSAVGSSSENDNVASVKGWVAPEYLLNGSASEKVDIFAFGVVLLELISAREDMDSKSFKESIGFLGGGASQGGCFDQLRSFMDPCLKEDYPLAEALCLAVLAKACVEDDPMHRPSMDDIMKVLSRMI